ncbi:hypothetical protein DPX16_1565 [Anabarilius grahami]|uniref:Uncharacterized protein n=1 Tax=Anabarilius grahami TaxID=495550 RepID=A0A3N0Z8A7_ANAGA|nr:hypothetical protein DPX16_1565 [Anabarilius grahami]
MIAAPSDDTAEAQMIQRSFARDLLCTDICREHCVHAVCVMSFPSVKQGPLLDTEGHSQTLDSASPVRPFNIVMCGSVYGIMSIGTGNV